MRKGFTLIELSIVLVIIGLLIGGILVAQSMISSAKLNAFVRQIQQYDIAMSNFQQKYNGIPGDSPLFNSVGCATTKGDGLIDWKQSDCSESQNYSDTSEVGKVWLDMQYAGVLNDGNTYVAFAGGNISTNSSAANLPAAKMGKNAGLMAISGVDGQGFLSALKGFYYICNFSQSTGGVSLGGAGFNAFNGREGLEIDSKMDDGNAGSGTIRAYQHDISGGGASYTNNLDNIDYMLMIKFMPLTAQN